jgi:hypothetical protein
VILIIVLPLLWLFYWTLVIAMILAVIAVWAAAYLVVFILTGIAMLVRSQWRPRRPGPPRIMGRQRPPPQATWSDRR